MARADFSVVIRALNEERYIGRCIKAIREQRGCGRAEIIVVDSGSSDSTREIARSHGCIVIGIRREEFTFGRALNIGVAHASHEIVVAISAHCVPAGGDWLAELTKPLVSGEAEMSFGTHVAGEGCRTSESNYFSSKFDIKEGYCVAPLMNNGNSAFVRSVWQTRPFNELVPAQEDIEFCLWHMSNNGSRLYFSKNAVVLHYHNDRNFSLFKRIYREVAVERHLGAVTWWDFVVLLYGLPLAVLRDVSAARRKGVLRRATKGILAFRAVQVLAYLGAMLTHKSYLDGALK